LSQPLEPPHRVTYVAMITWAPDCTAARKAGPAPRGPDSRYRGYLQGEWIHDAESDRNRQGELSPHRLAARRAGRRILRRLFELNPNLKPLFRGDLAGQGRAFFSMLGLIVKCLDIREQVVPIIYELGRRHASYGVSAIDFTTFEDALLQTLDAALGRISRPR